MARKIIVEIDNDGEVRLETRGYTGPVCLEESQFLKDLLGEETSRQLVPVFYQNNKNKKYLPICG